MNRKRADVKQKEQIIKQLLPPHNADVREISRKTGFAPQTLYRWRSEAREKILTKAFYSNGSSEQKNVTTYEAIRTDPSDIAILRKKISVLENQLEQKNNDIKDIADLLLSICGE